MTGCRLQTHSAAAADRPSHKTLAALCKTTRVQNLKNLFNPKAMLCCTVLAKRCIHSLGSRRLIQCLLWRWSARLVGIQNTAQTSGKAQERGGGGKCTLHRPQVEFATISSNQGAASHFLFLFHFGRAAMQFHLHLLFLILQLAAAQRDNKSESGFYMRASSSHSPSEGTASNCLSRYHLQIGSRLPSKVPASQPCSSAFSDEKTLKFLNSASCIHTHHPSWQTKIKPSTNFSSQPAEAITSGRENVCSCAVVRLDSSLTEVFQGSVSQI